MKGRMALLLLCCSAVYSISGCREAEAPRYTMRDYTTPSLDDTRTLAETIAHEIAAGNQDTLIASWDYDADYTRQVARGMPESSGPLVEPAFREQMIKMEFAKVKSCRLEAVGDGDVASPGLRNNVKQYGEVKAVFDVRFTNGKSEKVPFYFVKHPDGGVRVAHYGP